MANSEIQFRRELMAAIKGKDGMVIYVDPESFVGVPDLHVLMYGYKPVFMELKFMKRESRLPKLSKPQIRTMGTIEKNGGRAVWVLCHKQSATQWRMDCGRGRELGQRDNTSVCFRNRGGNWDVIKLMRKINDLYI